MILMLISLWHFTSRIDVILSNAIGSLVFLKYLGVMYELDLASNNHKQLMSAPPPSTPIGATAEAQAAAFADDPRFVWPLPTPLTYSG